MPASQAGQECPNLSQETWSRRESKLSINILELRAIKLALHHLPTFLMNTQSGCYQTMTLQWPISVIRGHQESSSLGRSKSNPLLGGKKCPKILPIYIPGVDDWNVDFLSHYCLDQGECSLLSQHLQSPVSEMRHPWCGHSASRLKKSAPVWGQDQGSSSTSIGWSSNSPDSFQVNICLPSSTDSCSTAPQDRSQEEKSGSHCIKLVHRHTLICRRGPLAHSK